MSGICGKNGQVTLLLSLAVICASVFGVATLVLYNENGRQKLSKEVQVAIALMVFVWCFGIGLTGYLMKSLFATATGTAETTDAPSTANARRELSHWWKVLALQGLFYWLASWWFLTTLTKAPASSTMGLWEWTFSAVSGSLWILAAALKTCYGVDDDESIEAGVVAGAATSDIPAEAINPLEEPLLQNV